MFVPQATSTVDLARIRRNFFAPASDRYPDFGKLCQKKTFVVLIGAPGCGRDLPVSGRTATGCRILTAERRQRVDDSIITVPPYRVGKRLTKDRRLKFAATRLISDIQLRQN